MSFDIRQLESIDREDEDFENASSAYRDELIELFEESPEGKNIQEQFPECDFYWVSAFLEMGRNHVGCTLTEIDLADAEELLEEVFPRKVTARSVEELEDAIPQLIAFWKYLGREHKLSQANKIIPYLEKVEPVFKEKMFDPHFFGPAKSFYMEGHLAGFDMSTQEGIERAILAQNLQALQASQKKAAHPFEDEQKTFQITAHGFKDEQKKAKAKAKKKLANKSRKQNRKKK